MVKYEHDFSKPTHMFEIKYSEEKERKFDGIKNVTRDTLGTDSVTSMSFHGTRMDNLYSILHTGLLAHLNKVYTYSRNVKTFNNDYESKIRLFNSVLEVIEVTTTKKNAYKFSYCDCCLYLLV